MVALELLNVDHENDVNRVFSLLFMVLLLPPDNKRDHDNDINSLLSCLLFFVIVYYLVLVGFSLEID